MPLPIIVAGAMAGLNLIGGLNQNAAIDKQATANWNANLMGLNQKRGVDVNNLVNKGREVNESIGIALTNLDNQARKAKASTIVTTTERNIYGATAVKLQGQVDNDAAAMFDNIVQKGEAAMTDVQMGFSNAMYAYNSGVQGASIQRQNMLNQKQGSFELLTGTVSAGISGYAMGKSLEG